MMAPSRWNASSRQIRFLSKSGVKGIFEVTHGMKLVMTRGLRKCDDFFGL